MNVAKRLIQTLLVSGTALAWSGLVLAASISQTITLHPGWNAIYVEVEPDENRIDRIFADVPVASVWRWIPPQAGADFVADPAEGLLSFDGWFGYFPPKRPESFLNNLHRLNANQAYLVEIEGTANHTITLTGKPLFRRKNWATDGYTLTGFEVDENNPPSLGDYFENSPAHADMLFFKLSADGHWQAVQSPYGETINRGEAYWVYTNGSSQWQGPLNLDIDGGDELDFNNTLSKATIVIANESTADATVTFNRVAGDTTPLGYELEDPGTQQLSYPDLTDGFPLNMTAGLNKMFTLAVRRGEFTQDTYEEIIELNNGQGFVRRFVIRAERTQPQTTTVAARGGLKATTAVNPYAGLWIGQVVVDAVSESQQAGVTPEPTAQKFPLKFLFHVNAFGEIKLLKEVFLMETAPVYAPSVNDPTLQEIVTPPRKVVLTDPALIANYSGVSLRDGQAVGRRQSTVAYDFPGNEWPMTGTFAVNQVMQTTLELAPDFPTNPFLHKYHPDHDNLDAQFLQYREEAYRVTRSMKFTFTPTVPDGGSTPPEWGSEMMGGTFEETITGLHKNPIFVSGTFRAIRALPNTTLNQ